MKEDITIKRLSLQQLSDLINDIKSCSDTLRKMVEHADMQCARLQAQVEKRTTAMID